MSLLTATGFVLFLHPNSVFQKHRILVLSTRFHTKILTLKKPQMRFVKPNIAFRAFLVSIGITGKSFLKASLTDL